jgi:hypothetical protein
MHHSHGRSFSCWKHLASRSTGAVQVRQVTRSYNWILDNRSSFSRKLLTSKGTAGKSATCSCLFNMLSLCKQDPNAEHQELHCKKGCLSSVTLVFPHMLHLVQKHQRLLKETESIFCRILVAIESGARSPEPCRCGLTLLLIHECRC